MVDITKQIDAKGNQLYTDFNITKVYTIATLPTVAQGAVLGARAAISNATAPTFLLTTNGMASGAVKTPVFHNGTDWVCG